MLKNQYIQVRHYYMDLYDNLKMPKFRLDRQSTESLKSLYQLRLSNLYLHLLHHTFLLMCDP